MNFTANTAIAGLADPQRAADAWNELTAEVPFGDLPHLVIRAMPQIYLTVKDEPHVNHFDLLKGVYRSFWTSNAVRFAAASDLFTTLNGQKIDYRVIKGGALCALAGNWAIRRMGDIDIVVAPGCEAQTFQILRTLKFLPRGDQDVLIDGPWDNEQGALLDLHVTCGKPALFTDLFSEDGSMRNLTNTNVLVPKPEFIFALTIWHAKKGTAGTDHIQSLIDIGTLINRVDVDRARKILVQSGLLDTALELLTELAELDLVSRTTVDQFKQKRGSDIVIEVAAATKDVHNKIIRLSTFPAVFKRRRLSALERNALRNTTGVRDVAYRVWASLGLLTPVEKFFNTHLGGLTNPDWQGGPIPDRDYRLRIPAIKGKSGRLQIDVTFDESGGSPAYRSLFINGGIQGFLPLPENVPGVYEITPEKDSVEVSLRSFSTSRNAPVKTLEVKWLNS